MKRGHLEDTVTANSFKLNIISTTENTLIKAKFYSIILSIYILKFNLIDVKFFQNSLKISPKLLKRIYISVKNVFEFIKSFTNFFDFIKIFLKLF